MFLNSYIDNLKPESLLMIKYRFAVMLIALSLTFFNNLYSIQNSYPVLSCDNPSPGYLLIGPQPGGAISLYDHSGNSIYTKNMDINGGNANALRILDNGNMAFFSSDMWYILNQKMELIDSIWASDQYITNFHSLRSSPAGGYLLVADELVVVNMASKVPGGQPTASILNNVIEEFDANHRPVFTWDVYDHVDVTDATEDISLTANHIDPYHINSACYDRDGNILANFRNMDCLIKINRSTGAIMWTMGGSKSKKNQFTFYNDNIEGFTGFSHQHDPKRLPNGNILLFDNGNLRPGRFSRAVEYEVNEVQKTATKVWEFTYNDAIWAEYQGNAQRLPNGNTLIGWGINYSNHAATEVTADGKIVMDFALGNNIYSYQVLKQIMMMAASQRLLNNIQTYYFNDYYNNTGVSVEIGSMTGSGYASVEKHNYAPRSLQYSTLQACSFQPYRWVLAYQGISDLTAKIYLDLSDFASIKNKEDLKIFWRSKENSGSFDLLETNYNQQLNRLEANITGYGEFFIGTISNPAPKLSDPPNQAVNALLGNTLLKWSSVSDQRNYSLMISTSEKFDADVSAFSLTNTEQYKCSLTKYNTKYYWKVKANNNQCDNKWSETFSFTTEICNSGLKYPPNNSIDQPISGTLYWNSVSGANRYKIMVSEDSSFHVYLVNQTLGDTCFYNYKNLKPLTKYYWKVSATNNDIYKNWTPFYCFTTGTGKVSLQSPANMQDDISPVHAKLSWQTVPTVINYSVQLSKDSMFQQVAKDTLITGSAEATISGLASSTIYYWRVKGHLKDTSTNWSERWAFRTTIGVPIPYYPANNSIDISTKSKLDWIRMNDAVSYQVQFSRDSTFSANTYNFYSKESYQFYWNIPFSTQFFWRVRAYDGKRYGDWSVVMNFTTYSQQTAPKYNSYKVSVGALLEWNEIDSADYYEIRMGKDKEFDDNSYHFSHIKDHNLRLSKLSNNTTYFWCVRSKKDSAFSDWSSPFSFTTQLVTPLPLIKNDSLVKNAQTFTLKWKASQFMDKYHLQVAYDSSFSALLLDNESVGFEQFKINQQMPDSNYYWRVMAVNSKNASEWSDTKRFTVSSTTDAGEDAISYEGIGLDNFPNPFNSATVIRFKLDKSANISLKIITADGREISTLKEGFLEQGDYNFTWDSSGMPSGTYFSVLAIGNSMISNKMTIIK